MKKVKTVDEYETCALVWRGKCPYAKKGGTHA